MNYSKYLANAIRATLDPDLPDVDAIDKVEQLLDEARVLREQIAMATAQKVAG